MTLSRALAAWLIQFIHATLVQERILIIGTFSEEGFTVSQLTKLGSGTIWICKHCDIWWGSQIGKRPSTNFLKQLDHAGLLPPWESYRGWKLVASQASVCLECGQRVAVPALRSN